MNWIIRSLIGLMFFVASVGAEILVSQVSIGQREGSKLIDIVYDVERSDGASVAVSVRIFDGTSWVGTSSFSGDIGHDVPVGSGLHIIWDGGADFSGTVSDLSISLQVSGSASDGMVRVPGGANSESGSELLMDATEVTKSMWDAVAQSAMYIAASAAGGKAPNHPVYDVTWYEALKWCNARSESEGLTPCYSLQNWSCDFSSDGYRLPTSDEWERAARGGVSGALYPWGSDDIEPENANYYSTVYDEYHPDYYDGSRPYTAPVSQFQPNGYGLYDMAGNVWELCNDTQVSGNVIRRGGSWDSWESDLQCNSVSSIQRSFHSTLLGFRTVRRAPPAVTYSDVVAFDSRDFKLLVESEFGMPSPGVGELVYPWKSTVNCSVQQVVHVDGTNYACVGWSGTGSVPASGNLNRVMVMPDESLSSLVWIWENMDSDADGMDDQWELDYFGELGLDGAGDADLDGHDEFSEYVAGTDPTNSLSCFLLQVAMGPDGAIIEWPAVSNRTYNLFRSSNLMYGEFKPVETNIVFPQHTTVIPRRFDREYYRMDVQKR